MKKPRLRSLLWFDCAAAAVAGTTVLALSGLLAPLFGVPRSVVVAFGLGTLWMVGEGVFVGVLAMFEARALEAAPELTGTTTERP